jgi:hypothetical protein
MDEFGVEDDGLEKLARKSIRRSNISRRSSQLNTYSNKHQPNKLASRNRQYQNALQQTRSHDFALRKRHRQSNRWRGYSQAREAQ